MEVYTDGACSGNPGPGGWAWIADDGRSGSGGAPHTTNQRMEVQAVLEAIRALPGPLAIHSDSTYVVNCFNDKWYEGWRKRGWKNSQKKPVANRDLWEPLIDEVLARGDEITFNWVKGHSGVGMNDLADQLAVEAAEAQKQEIAASAISAPVPWEKTSAIWVVGATTIDQEQTAELSRALDSLIRSNASGTESVLVTGLRRGTELLAAEQALQAGLPLAAVLPFDDPAVSWPESDKRRFDSALEQARWTVVLEGKRTNPGEAIELRNKWTADAALASIVVGDESLASALDDQGLAVISI